MNTITSGTCLLSLENWLSFLLERLESFQSVLCCNNLQENDHYQHTRAMDYETNLSIAGLFDSHSCCYVGL